VFLLKKHQIDVFRRWLTLPTEGTITPRLYIQHFYLRLIHMLNNYEPVER
jgi:hypothetical protein